MDIKRTERGFAKGFFKDDYNNNCSIQISSAAIGDFI